MDSTAGLCEPSQQELARFISQCTSVPPPQPDHTYSPSPMPIWGSSQQQQRQFGQPGQLPSPPLPFYALLIPTSPKGSPRLFVVDGCESDAFLDTCSKNQWPSFIYSGNPSNPVGSPPMSFNNAYANMQLNPNPINAALLEYQGSGCNREASDLDELIRSLNLDHSVIGSPPLPMSGRGADSTSENILFNEKDPMLVKRRLIQLLREQERAKGKRKRTYKVCVFCRNNGEDIAIYSCHQLKDNTGRVTCPILYCYTCPKCGANKENAHTLRYCPLSTGEVPGGVTALRTAHTSVGKKRYP